MLKTVLHLNAFSLALRHRSLDYIAIDITSEAGKPYNPPPKQKKKTRFPPPQAKLHMLLLVGRYNNYRLDL
jgi:hypothetical protein